LGELVLDKNTIRAKVNRESLGTRQIHRLQPLRAEQLGGVVKWDSAMIARPSNGERLTRYLHIPAVALEVAARTLVALTIVAALAPSSVMAGRTYAAFLNEDYSQGFDGVSATIGVVPASILNTVGFSVWVGFDAGQPVWTNTWLQAGWRWRYGYTNGQRYYEYTTYGGAFFSYPIELGDAINNGQYSVARNGDEVDFSAGTGFVDASQPWSSFAGGRKLCHAVYGAEIHEDPLDHCPGTAGQKCALSNIYCRS
jgi:hypothetical protein